MKKSVLIPYRNPAKLKPYEDAVNAVGLEPSSAFVLKPLNFAGIAGLLLMGGTDVNPKLYGASPAQEVDEPDDERDAVEWRLIDEALERDLPILAICRGMQMLNVHHGGSLHQHLGLPKHDTEFEDKSTIAHEVTIEPESHLADIVGSSRLRVNSRHHQGVDRLGEGLRVSARDSEDGTIEAFEQPTRRFVIAVQWHPEDQVSRELEQRKLFERFARACREV
ncbi:MAG: gamma-glutamyl-gamma-aminobutyrate hydrolase family protein [Bryobacteraceae bacterium]